jgi:uncharacterized protein
MGWMIFLLIGLVAGVLSGLFGIGGGVVIVPALIFIARMQPQAATGTSLAALLLPVGALGAWEYYRTGNLNFGAGLVVALGLFIGAGVGAKLSLQLSPATLRRGFAVFLALIAVRMWFSGDETPSPVPAATASGDRAPG